MTARKTKIDALQAMRAFAAICVMLFHGTQMIAQTFHFTFAGNVFMAGFMGVDIFFVLSGFIIYYTSCEGLFDVKKFLQKRFARVYPIYWIITILLILLYLAAPVANQSYKTDLGVVFRSFTLLPSTTYVLGVAWTLTYEMIFYLVFAFTFVFSPKIFFRTFMGWSAVIIACYLFKVQASPLSFGTFLNPIVLEFGFGCCIAWFFSRQTAFKYAKPVFVAGAVLLIAAWSVYLYVAGKYGRDAAFSGSFDRVYLFGLPSALLVLGAIYYKGAVAKVFTAIGDASYSLYLIHGTVLSLFLKLTVKFHLTRLLGNFPGCIVLFTMVVACSWLVHIWVEKPVVKQVNAVLKRKTKVHETGKELGQAPLDGLSASFETTPAVSVPRTSPK